MRCKGWPMAVLCAVLSLGPSLGSIWQNDTAPATPKPHSVRADNRPNFVVFYTDDMRADELKFMPKTCRLIRSQGLTFGRFYSNNPLCCPFRATALSGQYSHNNHVFGNSKSTHGGVYFFDAEQALPPYMQAAGYLTGYIGKYLNGYRKPINGTPVGWDEWYVPTHDIYAYHGTVINDNGTKRTYSQYITGVYERETNATIQRFADSGKPWMLFVSQLAPHGSGPKPPIPAKKYRGTVKVSDLPKAILEQNVNDKPSWIRHLGGINQAGINHSWQRRAESLKSVDDAVASAYRMLKETGELDNTYFIFTSDNGYMRGEHHIGHGKIVPYEPSSRMPFFFRGPGVPQGAITNDLAGAVDIAPTIASLAGVALPYQVDGRSLLDPMQHRKLLLESGPTLMNHVATRNGVVRFYSAVVDKRYKYIRYWNGETELYSMAGDRSENTNLADDPRYRQVVKRYGHWLKLLRNCRGHGCIVS